MSPLPPPQPLPPLGKTQLLKKPQQVTEMVRSQSNLFCRSSTKSANLELVTCTCTLVSCWFSSDSYNHSKTGGFMRVHVGTWILSLALLFSLGCNKPSQSNNSQNPDNSQANNGSPAATQDNSQPAPPPAP